MYRTAAQSQCATSSRHIYVLPHGSPGLHIASVCKLDRTIILMKMQEGSGICAFACHAGLQNFKAVIQYAYRLSLHVLRFAVKAYLDARGPQYRSTKSAVTAGSGMILAVGQRVGRRTLEMMSPPVTPPATPAGQPYTSLGATWCHTS